MGESFRILNADGAGGLVLTCEHASASIPECYGSLGLRPQEVSDHIGWDIGASAVARTLAQELSAPLVEAACSRLVIDCNRSLSDHDLVVAEVHEVSVPGNAGIDGEERARRQRAYYDPYHQAIDTLVAGRAGTSLLLSVHSFTPELRGQRREFDIGVLYDDHVQQAEDLIGGLLAAGFAVRRNQPYSALDGLIFSAQSHGRRHGIPYLEIEVNNGLIRRDDDARAIGKRIAAALRRVEVGKCESS